MLDPSNILVSVMVGKKRIFICSHSIRGDITCYIIYFNFSASIYLKLRNADREIEIDTHPLELDLWIIPANVFAL